MADNRLNWRAGLALTVLMSGPAMADTTLKFSGNLIIPNCVINDNTPVTVNFGDVEIQTLSVVGTVYHARDFTMSLNCPYTVRTPKLTLTSSAVHNATQGIIQTSKYAEGLVIHLRQKGGNTAIPLNTPTVVTNSVDIIGQTRTLTLNAGLAQTKGIAALGAGSFDASLTMLLRYE